MFIAVMIFSSCTGSRTSVKEDASSPCNDSLYLALQKRDSNTFTTSESNYFHKFRNECKEEIFQAGIADGNKTVLIGIGALAAALGLALYIALVTVPPSH